MKRYLVLFFAISLTNSLVAQNQVQLTNDSDTAFWYRYKNNNAKQFKLGLIENENTDYSFRFWSFGLVIKVTESAEKTSGEIVRFVEASPKDKSKKIFTKRYPISPQKALQIKQLIDSCKLKVFQVTRTSKVGNRV